MSEPTPQPGNVRITLRPVTKDNWRDVIKITVSEPQYEFVGRPEYYLTMCAYGGLWQPLSIYLEEAVIGFLMWAVDEADQSCWLGGIMIDQAYQGQGYGRKVLKTAVNMLSQQYGHKKFALSYKPSNTIGKHLYGALGFMETAEWEGDELVARMTIKENG
jgi:diamine N-acetyltransferase